MTIFHSLNLQIRFCCMKSCTNVYFISILGHSNPANLTIEILKRGLMQGRKCCLVSGHGLLSFCHCYGLIMYICICCIKLRCLKHYIFKLNRDYGCIVKSLIPCLDKLSESYKNITHWIMHSLFKVYMYV